MAQEMQSSIDRDCLIAATLAGGVDATNEQIVRRFREILTAILKAGGTYQMWSDAEAQSGREKSMIG